MNEPWRIMLNEISQTQKENYCMIPLLWGTQNSQIHRGRKENRGYQRWREGAWELLFKRTEFRLGRMRKFPRWVAVMVVQWACTAHHWSMLLEMAKMVNFRLYIFYHNKRFSPGRCLEGDYSWDLNDEKASGKAFPGPAQGKSMCEDPMGRASCCVLGPVRRPG